MKISVVIPNYNGIRLLQTNLSKVIKVINKADVVIVDDGSTDGSSAYIKKYFPEVTLIEKINNSGFATSVNLGVKAAKGDIVLLLNSDAIPKKDFLMPLIKHFKDKQVFAVGCMDQSIEGDKIIQRGRGVGKFTKGFLIHRRGEVDKTDTLWASGGSSVYRKEIWENIGGMDEIYDPFYWEDIDLSYRAQKAGYKVLFEPNSIVIHEHSKGSIKTHFSKEKVEVFAYRNQFIFIWKNITGFYYLFSHFIWLPYHLIMALLHKNVSMLKGVIQASIKIPEILKQRGWQKKLYLKSDQDILSQYS